MKPFIIFLALFVTCLWISDLYASKIYIWKDENGIEHFSDIPPPKKNAKDVKIMKFKEKKREKRKPTADILKPTEQQALDRIRNLIEENKRKEAKASLKKKGKKDANPIVGIEKLIMLLKYIEENYVLIWISAFLLVALAWIFMMVIRRAGRRR